MDDPADDANSEGNPISAELTAVPGAFGCYDLDHEPISMLDGAMLLSRKADRTIASTTINDTTISTVFLVFDHNHHRPGDPILYETMIFTADGDPSWCERYRTRDAALAGHDRACAWVRSPSEAQAPLTDVLPESP